MNYYSIISDHFRFLRLRIKAVVRSDTTGCKQWTVNIMVSLHLI